jgi:hypothetical protein
MSGRKGILEKQIRETLERDERSRNSDIRLTHAIWVTYYRKHIKMIDGKCYVDMKAMYELPREDNIKRIRAKIQNELLEFLPTDPEVARKRGWEIDDWRKYLGYPTGDTL